MLCYYCCIVVGLSFNNCLVLVLMKKESVNWDDISFILRGKHRKNILKLLENPKTPTQIKNETHLHFNAVSRAILELEKRGFVECLNPKQKLTRFYRITEKGKKILDDLDSI